MDLPKIKNENLPKELNNKAMSEGDIAFLQAILNVVDYIEIPTYINDEGSAEA